MYSNPSCWFQVPQPMATQQNMMAQSMGQGMGQGMTQGMVGGVNHGSLPTGMMGTLSGMGVGDCEYPALGPTLVASKTCSCLAPCFSFIVGGLQIHQKDSWLGYVLV